MLALDKWFVNRLLKIWITFFGVGYTPKGPGTWASAVAALLAWFFLPLWTVHLLLVLVTFAVSLPVVAWYLKESGKDDPSEVVIDEVIGIWVAVYALPPNWLLVALALVLFRVLDIFKPFPVSFFDQKNNAWGVLLDDLVAGAMVNLALHTLLYFGILAP